MKKIITLFLLINTLFAISQTTCKVATSAITFKIKNAGITVDGSFAGFIANIKFDGINYAKSFIEASVDVNTINTGVDLRNSHLKKDEYFNASKYPKINLKSTAFTKENDGTYKGFFKLTIKGVTKDIIIPFTYKEAGSSAIFKGAFTVNRRDYKVGGSSWTMADDVVINITINTTK
jgi:polyisoprenoid-binding protein YceI